MVIKKNLEIAQFLSKLRVFSLNFKFGANHAFLLLYVLWESSNYGHLSVAVTTYLWC